MSGYSTLNTQPFLSETFKSENYRRMYPKEMLDINQYNEQNKCPVNDQICNEEAVWLTQNMLLGTREDMKAIASAIEKVHHNVDKIKTLGQK